jgi:hypothetical protein
MFISREKIFSRTSRLLSISSLGKGNLNCSIQGPGPLQRGDNDKNAKNLVMALKIFSLENH